MLNKEAEDGTIKSKGPLTIVITALIPEKHKKTYLSDIDNERVNPYEVKPVRMT